MPEYQDLGQEEQKVTQLSRFHPIVLRARPSIKRSTKSCPNSFKRTFVLYMSQGHGNLWRDERKR